MSSLDHVASADHCAARVVKEHALVAFWSMMWPQCYAQCRSDVLHVHAHLQIVDMSS
jgi:hypothetical protein